YFITVDPEINFLGCSLFSHTLLVLQDYDRLKYFSGVCIHIKFGTFCIYQGGGVLINNMTFCLDMGGFCKEDCLVGIHNGFVVLKLYVPDSDVLVSILKV